jgi:hypothetical protein
MPEENTNLEELEVAHLSSLLEGLEEDEYYPKTTEEPTPEEQAEVVAPVKEEEKPAEEAVAEEQVEEKPVEEPTPEEPVEEKAEEAPVTEEPVKEEPEVEPVEEVAEEPVNQGLAEEPTNQPLKEVPIEEVPFAPVVEEEPVKEEEKPAVEVKPYVPNEEVKFNIPLVIASFAALIVAVILACVGYVTDKTFIEGLDNGYLLSMIGLICLTVSFFTTITFIISFDFISKPVIRKIFMVLSWVLMVGGLGLGGVGLVTIYFLTTNAPITGMVLTIISLVFALGALVTNVLFSIKKK